MPVFGATLENASLFLTYNFVQAQLRNMAGMNRSSSSTSSLLQEEAEAPLPMAYLSVAGAAAGATTSLVLTPVELVKCKMQVQMVAREVEALAAGEGSAARGGMAAKERLSNAFAGLDGPGTIIRGVVRQQGVRGLWLGQMGTLLRETGGGVAWFLAFEWASRAMMETMQTHALPGVRVTKKDLSSTQLIGAGALAGISYNIVLFPADSVKSTMQTEREWAVSQGRLGTFRPKGFMATLRALYAARGVRGLYAGCGITCMRSAPSSALIFLLYNKLEGLAEEFGM